MADEGGCGPGKGRGNRGWAGHDPAEAGESDEDGVGGTGWRQSSQGLQNKLVIYSILENS